MMNRYRCIKKQKYLSGRYSIVPLRKKDIRSIKDWRNEQIDILRQKNILTSKEQTDYYNKVIKKSFSKKFPEMIIFSFMLDNNCIGYGGFVNIDWDSRRAEVSFLTKTYRSNNKNMYKKDFQAFLKLIIPLAFNEIVFNKLLTETFDIRPTTLDILEKVGFGLEGRLKNHIRIKNSNVDSILHGYFREDFLNEKPKFD